MFKHEKIETAFPESFFLASGAVPPNLTVMHVTGTRTRPALQKVTAVLGPTNTGKTFFAIERMLAHKSGMIGLPLRLLAREVYGKGGGHQGRNPARGVTG